jgi:Spy/CpxP family protein refolding chaperone
MTPEQRAQKQTERMQEALQLTADQKKAIYELNLQSAKDRKAAKGEAREANREKFKAMHEQKDARLKSILSAEQFKKYQATKAERMNKMKNKRAENKGLRQG